MAEPSRPFFEELLDGPFHWDSGAWSAVLAFVVLAGGLIGARKVIRRAIWPDPAAPRTVPACDVYGRGDQLARIRETLAHDQPGKMTPAVVLTGAGGVGKSTLARHYLSSHRADYTHAHLIPAETEQQLMASLGAIFPDTAGNRARDRAQETLRRINASPDPWLIVYDNVPDQKAIEGWIPNGQRTHCLVTTRSGGWSGPGFHALPLAPLSPEAAVKVLESEAGRTSPDAADLAEKLGYLPLALVQAGALLRENPGQSFAAYGEDLDVVIQTAPKSGDYPDSIFASVSLSLMRRTPDEMALLNLFAFLATEGLEARLVGDLPNAPNIGAAKDDIFELIWALAQDAARLDRAMAALERRSLLTAEGEGAFSLHRLTAAVLRSRLGDKAGEAAASAAAVIAASFPRHSDTHATWPDCARLTPHVAALHRNPPATAAMSYLYNQAALYLDRQAERDTALAYAEAGLHLKIARLGSDHRDVGLGHSTLGLRLKSQERLDEAEDHLRKALRISEALGAAAAEDLPKDFSNIATVLEGLGVRDRAAGDPDVAAGRFEEAERFYRRALDLDREQQDRAGEATSLNNLAALKAAMGDLPAAIGFAEQAVAIVEEILTPNDPLLGNGLNNLGSYRLRARDPAAARDPLQRALEIFENAFPDRPGRPPHPDRVAAAVWLATCLFALDPPEAAAEALCARYGLDPEKLRANARAIMAPGG